MARGFTAFQTHKSGQRVVVWRGGSRWNVPVKMGDTEDMKKEEVKELRKAEENGDEDGEAWAENEMSTRCKGQQTRLWTAEEENEDNMTACDVKREGGYTRSDLSSCRPSHCCNHHISTSLCWCNSRKPKESTLSLCSLHLSEERWDHSYKMHVSSELFIMLFISLSYRGDVSLKNHEMSWLRCRVHQNVVPVTANLTSTCPGQNQTWQSKESILLYLSTTQHRSTSKQHSCSYLSPKGTALNLGRCFVPPSK